jgi:hypothetical protein
MADIDLDAGRVAVAGNPLVSRSRQRTTTARLRKRTRAGTPGTGVTSRSDGLAQRFVQHRKQCHVVSDSPFSVPYDVDEGTIGITVTAIEP